MQAINCKPFYRYHKTYSVNEDLNFTLYDSFVTENPENKYGYERHIVMVSRVECGLFGVNVDTLNKAQTLYYRGYMIKGGRALDSGIEFNAYKFEDEENLYPENQSFESSELAMFYIDRLYAKEEAKQAEIEAEERARYDDERWDQ